MIHFYPAKWWTDKVALCGQDISKDGAYTSDADNITCPECKREMIGLSMLTDKTK